MIKVQDNDHVPVHHTELISASLDINNSIEIAKIKLRSYRHPELVSGSRGKT